MTTLSAPVSMHDTSHPVPHLEHLYPRTDLNDSSDGLMAENPPRGSLGHVTLQDVKVRTADRGAINPHDGVAVVVYDGVGHVFPAHRTWSFVHEGLHRDLLPSPLSFSHHATKSLGPLGPKVSTPRRHFNDMLRGNASSWITRARQEGLHNA
jgi:hypothetical protein